MSIDKFRVTFGSNEVIKITIGKCENPTKIDFFSMELDQFWTKLLVCVETSIQTFGQKPGKYLVRYL